MIRIVLVDDHVVLRDGMSHLISLERDMTVVGEASDGHEALKKIKETKPDVVLLDVNMPRMNGIETLMKIRQANLDIRVLMLTMLSGDEYLFAAISHGANGYLLKDSPFSQVTNAIRNVCNGGAYLHPHATERLMYSYLGEEKQGAEALSPREKDVFALLVKGESNRDIAQTLYISERTVKVHISKIYRKLGVKTRSQAMMIAMNQRHQGILMAT